MAICPKGSKIMEGWPSSHTVSISTCKAKFTNMEGPACEITYTLRVDGKQSSSYKAFASSYSGSNTEEQIKQDANSQFQKTFQDFIKPLCSDTNNFLTGELKNATDTWQEMHDKADKEYNALKAKRDAVASALADEYNPEVAKRMIEMLDWEAARDEKQRLNKKDEMEANNASDNVERTVTESDKTAVEYHDEDEDVEEDSSVNDEDEDVEEDNSAIFDELNGLLDDIKPHENNGYIGE